MSTTEKLLSIQGERRHTGEDQDPLPADYGISDGETSTVFEDLIRIDKKYEFFGTSAIKAADIAFAALDILRKKRQPYFVEAPALGISIPRPIRFHRQGTGHAGFRYVVDNYFNRIPGVDVRTGMSLDERQVEVSSVVQVARLEERSIMEYSRPYDRGLWMLDNEISQEHVMYMFADENGDFRGFK